LAHGLGATCGDSLERPFKRRLGIEPGAPWVPANQLDFVVGALALAWRLITFGWRDVASRSRSPATSS
jgi:CDP-2,3-bis-(O-geranylgeranyl)-sn-glycerol synthase